ncbi:hypothetical protein M3D15_04735 [Pseudoclavibacter alba]|uniref:YqaJ viral recombinase domain-containing protein n=1 Tax=Pseudoclavibacter albus TaxID=272241 RepID=A0ABT2HWF5_9MICO|nr:hypothetical protein [Pseudoclavibacter alba]MCT2042641.1 hypothetical protein [Pseudoclavibacter alba]
MRIVDVTPDTDEWLTERRASVGASEAAALVGTDHWGGTPLQVYLGKIGARVKPFPEVLSYVTHAAEPLIAGYVEKFAPEIGSLEPGFMARRDDTPWLHATFDRVTYRDDGQLIPVQFKTSHPFSRRDWEGGLLPQYKVQEDVECWIADAPYAWVVVWHYGDDFQVFKHTPQPAEQARVVEAARRLMECVERREPPSAQLGDDLAALYPPISGAVVRADLAVVDAVEMLAEAQRIKREHAAEQDKDIDAAKFEIEQYMKDATELVAPDGRLIHTWRPDKNGKRRHWTPKREDTK